MFLLSGGGYGGGIMSSYVMGVEIGGTKLQAGIGFEGENLRGLVREAVDPAQGPKAILAGVESIISKLLKKTGLDLSDIGGIGVGFGGPVEAKKGLILTSHQVEGWGGFDLGGWFEQTFGIQTTIENDSSAAALAEAVLGAGQGYSRVFYTNIGSGVGGGWVVDGVVDNGQGIGAAEIGHTYVSFGGTPPDKVEDICSGWAIGRRARAAVEKNPESLILKLASGNPDAISAVTVADAAKQRDPLALRLFDETGHAFGISLANLITLLHPQAVVIGGGVSLAGDLFLDRVRDYVKHYVFHLYSESYHIVPAALGEKVVVIGAALLARQMTDGGKPSRSQLTES